MKRISDLSVFRWPVLPVPGKCWGMEFFLHPARRSYRMYQLYFHPADTLLRVENMCEVDTLPGAHYLRRHAQALSLEYVKEGSLLVRQRGKGYELEAGELFLMQPDLEGEFLCGSKGCCKMSLLVTGDLLGDFLEKSGLSKLDVMSHPNPLCLEQLFRKVCELAHEPNPAPGRNAALAFEVMQSLLLPPETVGLPVALKGLLDKINEHPEENWTQQTMATVCHCSGTHLVRLFRHYLNTTPWHYVNDIRMKAAHQYLTNTQLSIKEIAVLCGFNDAMIFSTSFRRRFGMSPRQFRTQLSFFHT